MTDKIHNNQRVLGVEIVGSGGASTVGDVDDAPYSDDTGAADGSLLALLRGIYVQNAAIISLLDDIKTNTSA